MRIEMHAHTMEASDCARLPAETVVREHARAGYDAIVITNHFAPEFLTDYRGRERLDQHLLGYDLAKKAGEECGIRVFLGMELRLRTRPDTYNDFLIYGIRREFIYENPLIHDATLQEASRICRQAGALIYQAHPLRRFCRPQDPDLLDGVELNQNGHEDQHNPEVTAWARQFPHLRVISGSDYHDYPDVGMGGVSIEEPVEDGIELAKYLRERRPVSLITRP